MTGLLLLVVLGIWLAFVIFITPKLTGWVRHTILKRVIQIVLFLSILVLPLADEIIGGIQFRELCRNAEAVKVDESKTVGRTVILKLSDGKNVGGTAVAIREQSWKYVDHQNGEELLSYKTFRANGGWLISALGISETNAPLSFHNVCGPSDAKTIFKNLNIKIIYK